VIDMRANRSRLAGGLILALALTSPAVAAPDAPGAAAAPATSQAEGAGLGSASHRAEDIVGSKVYSEGGRKIGSISAIVRDPATDDLLAVVGIGGFFGIGAKDVTIALKSLRVEGDRLLTPAGIGEESLKAGPEYRESLYEAVPGERMVWIGQPGALTAGEWLAFGRLDGDRDGFLSRQESQGSMQLAERWQVADTNGDDRIDRAEFSAFEMATGEAQPAQGEPAKPMQGQMPGQMPSQMPHPQTDKSGTTRQPY
jgi:hypothetical protein